MSEDDRKARSREVAERLGDNLRRTRRRAGLSQEQVAIRASLHRTEIGLLERGGRVARVDTLIQLAGAMSVHPAELLDGIGWTPGAGVCTAATTTKVGTSVSALSPAIASRSSVAEPGPICVVLVRIFVIGVRGII